MSISAIKTESFGIQNLPFELILKISEHLQFSDIWYLATCSKHYRSIAYQIILHSYRINLIRPRIINPLSQLIHAAVAFQSRHGYDPITHQIDPVILQSVTNRLAIEIYDRTPLTTELASSLDFLLDKSLDTLFDHVFCDPSLSDLYRDGNLVLFLNKSSPEVVHMAEIVEQTSIMDRQSDMTKQSNILTADLIATLYSTLTALFTIDMVRPILRHLLIKHLDRHVNFIAQRYRQHHLGKIEMAIKNTSSPKYQLFLFVRFMCALLQNNLVEPSDIDHLVYQRLGALFITQPSDVFFEITSGVEVKIKASTAPVCNSSDAFYFCRLWIEETRFRMAILLDLSYAALQHRYRYGHGHSLGFPLIIGMIREASSAFRLSKQSISVNE